MEWVIVAIIVVSIVTGGSYLFVIERAERQADAQKGLEIYQSRVRNTPFAQAHIRFLGWPESINEFWPWWECPQCHEETYYESRYRRWKCPSCYHVCIEAEARNILIGADEIPTVPFPMARVVKVP